MKQGLLYRQPPLLPDPAPRDRLRPRRPPATRLAPSATRRGATRREARPPRRGRAPRGRRGGAARRRTAAGRARSRAGGRRTVDDVDGAAAVAASLGDRGEGAPRRGGGGAAARDGAPTRAGDGPGDDDGAASPRTQAAAPPSGPAASIICPRSDARRRAGEGRRGTAGADGGGTRVVRRGERSIRNYSTRVIVAACSDNIISPPPPGPGRDVTHHDLFLNQDQPLGLSGAVVGAVFGAAGAVFGAAGAVFGAAGAVFGAVRAAPKTAPAAPKTAPTAPNKKQAARQISGILGFRVVY